MIFSFDDISSSSGSESALLPRQPNIIYFDNNSANAGNSDDCPPVFQQVEEPSRAVEPSAPPAEIVDAESPSNSSEMISEAAETHDNDSSSAHRRRRMLRCCRPGFHWKWICVFLMFVFFTAIAIALVYSF